MNTNSSDQGLNSQGFVRGRPRTIGSKECDRCHQPVARFRIVWRPEGRICGICFHNAMRTYGDCPECGTHRLLPGRSPIWGEQPVCVGCARIDDDFHCHRCGVEGEFYRKKTCARCALTDDLRGVLGLTEDGAEAEKAPLSVLLNALINSDRPESIITWMRPEEVKDLLRRIGTGELALTHAAFDAERECKRTEHIRSLLVHHELLPDRDHYLALFTRWLEVKLDAIDHSEIRRPVETFARWHHLRRIRTISATGKSTRGPVHSSKQEITETIKFLTWLAQEHGRTVATCLQADVDEWISSGPTTRTLIRTFFVWAVKTKTASSIVIGFREAKTDRMLSQEQRLIWLRECLTEQVDTLPYRIAASLLLLYAQPIVKIAQLRTTDIVLTPMELRINLGATDPSPIPEPFANLLREYLQHRTNLRTSGAQSLWLFPGYRPGRHIHPGTMMDRLRDLGINLLSSRNRALRSLVQQMPAAIVAEMLGYSYQVTERHAARTSAAWSRYADALPRTQAPN